jgi:hypothetical protein
MEAVRSFETLINICHTTRCNIVEDIYIHIYCRENLNFNNSEPIYINGS